MHTAATGRHRQIGRIGPHRLRAERGDLPGRVGALERRQVHHPHGEVEREELRLALDRAAARARPRAPRPRPGRPSRSAAAAARAGARSPRGRAGACAMLKCSPGGCPRAQPASASRPPWTRATKVPRSDSLPAESGLELAEMAARAPRSRPRRMYMSASNSASRSLELRLAALELERALLELLLLLLEPLRAPLEPLGGDETLAEEIVVLVLDGRSRRLRRRGSRHGTEMAGCAATRATTYREDVDVRHRRLVPSAAPDTRGVVSILVAHAAHDYRHETARHPSYEGVRFRQRLRSCELFLRRSGRVSSGSKPMPRRDVLARGPRALGEEPAEERRPSRAAPTSPRRPSRAGTRGAAPRGSRRAGSRPSRSRRPCRRGSRRGGSGSRSPRAGCSAYVGA